MGSVARPTTTTEPPFGRAATRFRRLSRARRFRRRRAATTPPLALGGTSRGGHGGCARRRATQPSPALQATSTASTCAPRARQAARAAGPAYHSRSPPPGSSALTLPTRSAWTATASGSTVTASSGRRALEWRGRTPPELQPVPRTRPERSVRASACADRRCPVHDGRPRMCHMGCSVRRRRALRCRHGDRPLRGRG